jgi:hypothetical protein
MIGKWHYLRKEYQFADGSSVLPDKIIVKDICIDDKTDQVVCKFVDSKGEQYVKPIGYLNNYHENATASILEEGLRGKTWSL